MDERTSKPTIFIDLICPNWWPTPGLVPTKEAHDASVRPPQKLKTPREASLDVYYELLAHDPNQRYSGLSENDVEELRQIMTEMDGVQVTPEEAWETARSLLELTGKMLRELTLSWPKGKYGQSNTGNSRQ